MRKTTNVESSVLEVIESRRSKRAYAPRPVEPEKIKSLFEAARWAPSSMNEQPWRYIYVTQNKKELHQLIAETLNAANQSWAARAPLLIVSLARKNFTRTNAPNSSARYDVGSANAFLSLQATHLGLNVHQMAGFSTQKVRDLLNVPEDYDVVVIIAVGYSDDPAVLPEHLQIREVAPRERFTQDSFVMNSMFYHN
jgi:nitroreductase